MRHGIKTTANRSQRGRDAGQRPLRIGFEHCVPIEDGIVTTFDGEDIDTLGASIASADTAGMEFAESASGASATVVAAFRDDRVLMPNRTAALNTEILTPPVRTTVPDAARLRPLDWVNRQFKAIRPNQLRVSDFIYDPTPTPSRNPSASARDRRDRA